MAGVCRYDPAMLASQPSPPASPAPDARALYIDLLKGCLTRDLFPEDEIVDVVWWQPGEVLGDPQLVWSELHRRGWRLVKHPGGDPEERDGRTYPAHAETMVGRRRLDNVEDLVTQVLRDGVPGDLVETGVWRGGTVIFMRALLQVHGDAERRVWVCDSFEGLPEPDPSRYPEDASMQIHDVGTQEMFRGLLGVPVEQVQANFARYGLLDDRVRFVEGWFSDSLPGAPIDRIALLRLDGDLYESTMDSLVNLEPRVSPGGFVIVDDYGGLEACRKAVEDYRAARGITDPIVEVDWTGAYWQKSGAG